MADKDLNEVAKEEKLSVDHYLTLLEKPNVFLAVCQRLPKTLKDAVSVTLNISVTEKSDIKPLCYSYCCKYG